MRINKSLPASFARLFTLITLICLVLEPTYGGRQTVSNNPITLENLLSALEYGRLNKSKRRPVSWYVGMIKENRVSFQLTTADEQKIRRVGSYLGGKGLDDLVAVVRENYRIDKSIIQPSPQERPDISLRLVYPKGFAVVFANESNVVLREPKYIPIMWNLDREKWNEVLPIPIDSGDWIRPKEFNGPNAFITQDEILPLIKRGDRLFGVIHVTCPECIRTKSYWVYAVHGAGGFYAEFPEGHHPDMSDLFKALPEVRKNPDKFFSDIPQEKRVAIADRL